MSNSNYIEFNRWLKHFIALRVEESLHYPFPIYRRRFEKESLQSQLSVIYANYNIIMNKDTDDFSRSLIIENIISDRYETLTSLGKSIQETNSNNETLDTINKYLCNCTVIKDEITILTHEKDIIERRIRKARSK